MWSMQKRNAKIDSLCCTEVPAIIEDKFERKKCITLAHEFELLCLNKTFQLVCIKLEVIPQKMLRTYRIESCFLQPISNLFGGFFSIWEKGIDKLSCPVQYGQLENFFQRQMDSIIGLKKVKEIDQMHIKYIKLKHYDIIYTLNKVLVKFHRCNFSLKTLIFVFQ